MLYQQSQAPYRLAIVIMLLFCNFDLVLHQEQTGLPIYVISAEDLPLVLCNIEQYQTKCQTFQQAHRSSTTTNQE